MDFQVSSPSNHFFSPAPVQSNTVCNYRSTMGAPLIGCAPQGREGIAARRGEHPRTSLGDGAGSHLMLLGCPMGTAGTWES